MLEGINEEIKEDILEANPKEIILTTGVYDLIKDHIRRRRVTPLEEELLNLQLKHSTQVTRKELPEDVVTVDTRVTIKKNNTGEEETYVFVGPAKASKKNKSESILSKVGLALVGCKQGDVIKWILDGEETDVELTKVERL